MKKYMWKLEKLKFVKTKIMKLTKTGKWNFMKKIGSSESQK